MTDHGQQPRPEDPADTERWERDKAATHGQQHQQVIPITTSPIAAGHAIRIPADPTHGQDGQGDTLLTEAEHRAMDLTVELVNLVTREVIGSGRSRPGDVNELVRHIHGIQHMVLSQAAARAYPERYRLLGSTFEGAQHG